MFIEPGVVNSCTPLGVLCGARKELVLGSYGRMGIKISHGQKWHS